MITLEVKDFEPVVVEAIRALNAEPSQNTKVCKVCWEASVYYPEQVDGWHPMAEYALTHQDDGSWYGSASAPTYRPAWLNDFTARATAATPVELFRALERQVDEAWRLQAAAHSAALSAADSAPQQ